uniref:Uncharacterized protein n=1 Tax=Arundo donax TaxID=35708 RepID=A0A0A9D5B6_ARUDO
MSNEQSIIPQGVHFIDTLLVKIKLVDFKTDCMHLLWLFLLDVRESPDLQHIAGRCPGNVHIICSIWQSVLENYLA